MATRRETLPSPWHLTHTETLRALTGRGPRPFNCHALSEHRKMKLPGDLSPFHMDQHLRAAERLQWRWEEMKERERKARQHNRKLLQEFEKAQDALREMVVRTAAMNTIRMEYERYLEESAPRWQQQLKEKTLSAERKRMETYLTEHLKRIEEEEVRRVSAEARPAPPPQGNTKQPQNAAAPREFYSPNSPPDYNHHGSSRPRTPSLQSSWLTHTHSLLASFPSRTPFHPQGSSHVYPSFHPPPDFPHHHPFQPHHLSSTPSHHPTAPQQEPPGWATLQTDYPSPRAASVAGFPSGSSWTRPSVLDGRGKMQDAGEEAERGTGTRPEGQRSRRLSQELDINPVRLSSGPGESSESSRTSSQSNKSQERKRRREERGRTGRCTSDREEGSSQESSKTSRAVVVGLASAGRRSGSDSSSEIGGSSSSGRRRRRSGGLSFKPQRMKEQLGERTRSEGDDSGRPLQESRSQIAEDLSPGDKSEPGSGRDESGSHVEESGSVSVKIEDGGAEEETEGEQESSGAEPKDRGKGREEEPGETDRDVEEVDDVDVKVNDDSSRSDGEEEDRGEDDEEDKGGEDDEERMRKNTAEEEEGEMEEQESERQGRASEDGQSDGEDESEESENEREGSSTSQDGEIEEGSKGGEESVEDEEGSDEKGEEERRSDGAGEPEEERDSEDSVILPQQHRSVKIQNIPEEEEEESNGESADDSSEDDGIERLLAPQTSQTQNKEEKDPKPDDKTKAGSDDVDDSSVEAADTTDSDESDHFYD